MVNLPNWGLSISKNSYHTFSGQPGHCSTILTGIFFSHMFNWNFTFLHLSCLLSSCYAASGRVSPILLYNHSLGNWRFLLILLCPGSAKPVLSTWLYCLLLQPLSVLLAFFWTLAGINVSLVPGVPILDTLFHTRAHDCQGENSPFLLPPDLTLLSEISQPSNPSCYSPVCRGIFVLRGHMTDMFNLLFTRTTIFFPGEPSRVQLFSCVGLIHPRGSFCALLCWTARVFSWPISPACQCPSEWQLCPPEYWSLSLVWYCLQICWECIVDYCPRH